MSRPFLHSSRHAIRGIRYAIHREKNIRIQLAIACVVLLFSFLFQISYVEWVIVLLSIMFIIVIEMINSVIEASIDVVKPRLSSQIKIIKDMMAGAVLVASMITGIVGAIIFIPYMFELLLK